MDQNWTKNVPNMDKNETEIGQKTNQKWTQMKPKMNRK